MLLGFLKIVLMCGGEGGVFISPSARGTRFRRERGSLVKRIRYPVAMLVVWLVIFYNIERIGGRVNTTEPIHVLVPVVIILIIFVSHTRQVPLWALCGIPIPVFLVLKVLAGHRVWGTALPVTVTEVGAIVLTAVLARWVSNSVNEFEEAVARITTGRAVWPSEPSAEGQIEIYRELRRARRHNRPLVLMAIGIEEESLSVIPDRMVQEAQQAVMKHYVLCAVSKVLCDELEDYHIIAREDDRFWVLLPEATSAGVTNLVDSLHKTLLERAGVDLRIGAASFPDDGLTFDSLMEKAISEIEREKEPRPPLRI
jgi:GGDEF domain-containing protein